MLIDTHCHIHDSDYPLDTKLVISNALRNRVNHVICIGTDLANSRLALEFSNQQPDFAFSAVGVHPHNAKDGCDGLESLLGQNSKAIAIGEIGLDYHYNFSPKADQIAVLTKQLELSIKYDLPIIFHVREAFDDFWRIYDSFIESGNKIRGVVHSFTDSPENAAKALARGLYIGVNGFSTFTKDESQKAMFAQLPLDKILLETDAPYLTPAPFRGKINEPAFVKNVAEHHAKIRGMTIDEIASVTSSNASLLFNI